MKINERGCGVCIHKNVCKYCNVYEASVSKLKDSFSDRDDILEITVECKNFERNSIVR